jgi:hypothetical protein
MSFHSDFIDNYALVLPIKMNTDSGGADEREQIMLKKNRPLRFETLEFRELLSVSALPQVDFEPADSAYTDNADNKNIGGQNLSGQNESDSNDSSQKFAPLAASSNLIYLAPPKSARPAYVATPTTLEVYWTSPVATGNLKTDEITDFEVVIRNSKTKAIIATESVTPDTRSILFEGLDVKTRYEIVVTSRGGDETSSDRAALRISATTAAFPAITARASNLTLSSATLTITDKDKITPFVDGKTTKTYTIQYVEKVTSTPVWSNALSVTISSGTQVIDVAKGTVAVSIQDLKPGVQYFFRVLTSYSDGQNVPKDISIDGRHSTLKTLPLPATTLSKSFFSLNSNSGLTIGLNGKVANANKLDTSMTVSFSLWVSTATAVEKTTGKLNDAVEIPSSDITFTSLNAKGEFSMSPVSLETLITALSSAKMLASKTISFQLEVSFGGITTTKFSKMIRVTMPTWYNV